MHRLMINRNVMNQTIMYGVWRLTSAALQHSGFLEHGHTTEYVFYILRTDSPALFKCQHLLLILTPHYKKKTGKCICGSFVLMAGTPTHLFMESLTVMGARLVFLGKKKGGDSWRKEDCLPGSACLEGVPSPVQLGRIRDGHGSS